MGQKVNPNGLRYGIIKNWQSRWIPQDNKQMAEWLVGDDKIRTYLFSKYPKAMIDHVEIERTSKSIDVFVYAAQPGILIGTEGSESKKSKLAINKIVGRNIKVNLNILAVEKSELCARIIAREIADAIERRVSFRNAQKFALRKVMKAGAKGVKTHVSGRLGGVEMAREEGYSEGVIPLSTLRADIDYAIEKAHTTYGIIGVKVWINRGEVFSKKFTKPAVKKSNRSNDSRNRKPFNKKSDGFKRNKNFKPNTKRNTNGSETTNKGN